jgi:alpha-tubulin suppressor-like RCC1 family protein
MISYISISGYAATAIALGRYHTCAIVAGGTLKCWGDNGYGQLGIYNYNTQISPADVLGSGMARDTNPTQRSFYPLFFEQIL